MPGVDFARDASALLCSVQAGSFVGDMQPLPHLSVIEPGPIAKSRQSGSEPMRALCIALTEQAVRITGFRRLALAWSDTGQRMDWRSGPLTPSLDATLDVAINYPDGRPCSAP